MKLLDIFTQLTHGELSQINIGGGENGEILPANYMQVVSHVNLGLTALHKRFPLREGRFTIELQPGMATYVLKSAYAKSHRNSKEIRYIDDSQGQAFEDDILKVERVYTKALYELGLNDESDPLSVFTPSATVLRIPPTIVDQSRDLPEYLRTDTLEVVYRANHPIITEDNGGDYPEDMEVDLPYSHLEALLYFVASRVNNPMGMHNEFHAGNSYFAKYEAECDRLEYANLRVDQGSQNTRMERGGWP